MSLTIGITGAQGLLGWHTAVFLRTLPEVSVLLADRKVFDDSVALEQLVSQCDIIFHCAGMNRGSDAEVAKTNFFLTQALINVLDMHQHTPHVVFANSIHADRDTVYGRSKRECALLFKDWALRSGSLFTNLILPNVFGESGKPFYNSVVSTFCYQVAFGETPTVHQDIQLEQIHAQTVSQTFWDLVLHKHGGDVRLQGQKVSVLGLLEMIRGFHDLYRNHIIPDVRNDFDCDLFNTYRSYLYPNIFPRLLTPHADLRGSLFEAVKTLNGGQTFLSTTKPGITRGNHFHIRKIERFLVISGEAKIQVRRVLDSKIENFNVSSDQPCYVDIPTLHTHNITNTGSSELITLFWAHEFYRPEMPDTVTDLV